MLKKIITWAIVIFLAFYLLTQPTGAANVIHGLLDLPEERRQFPRDVRELAVSRA